MRYSAARNPSRVHRSRIGRPVLLFVIYSQYLFAGPATLPQATARNERLETRAGRVQTQLYISFQTGSTSVATSTSTWKSLQNWSRGQSRTTDGSLKTVPK